ncbi:MAG: hypothetical protein ACYC1D_13770 [Acidimicrobiales bacterium]
MAPASRGAWRRRAEAGGAGDSFARPVAATASSGTEHLRASPTTHDE